MGEAVQSGLLVGRGPAGARISISGTRVRQSPEGYFLIGLHAAAALFHHYVRKDDTLVRMLPGGRRSKRQQPPAAAPDQG